MNVIGVIPARYGSTRFPGKPLALINGKPMIQHVYERVSKSIHLNGVYVATDHELIRETVEAFGGNVVLTDQNHETGSDRIEEVSRLIDGDFFVNIQGDEPLISNELIDEIVLNVKSEKSKVITAKTRILHVEDINNPNVVKVVTDKLGNALYFSRSTIPYNRAQKDVTYYKHLGIYAYPKEVLREFVKLPTSHLENIEMLEQLRLIENGYSIKVVETEYDAVGVDTPEDIEKVERLLGGTKHD